MSNTHHRRTPTWDEKLALGIFVIAGGLVGIAVLSGMMYVLVKTFMWVAAG